jgi:hypothetical protein
MENSTEHWGVSFRIEFSTNSELKNTAFEISDSELQHTAFKYPRNSVSSFGIQTFTLLCEQATHPPKDLTKIETPSQCFNQHVDKEPANTNVELVAH